MGDLRKDSLSKAQKPRFWELDFLRGVCVLLMVFDHCMYTIGFVMPGINPAFWGGVAVNARNYFYGDLRTGAHAVVLFILFLTCGISCTLSRSNLKRGGLCFLVGCGITFFTVLADMIFDMGISIYFGVLHMLGVSIMIYGLLDKFGALMAKPFKEEKATKIAKTIGEYLAPTVGLILFIVFFACFYSGTRYGLFYSDIRIEDSSMSMLASLFLPLANGYVIGGADPWSLLPWAAIVLMGGFIGRAVYGTGAQNYLTKLDGAWNKPISFVGKHALFIYAAHQVVIFVICYLITLIFA